MRRKTTFNMGGLIAHASFAGLIISVCLGLAGCNDQIARIEESQLELQTMVEVNAERISTISSNLEQNQEALEVRVEDLQNGTQNVAADMAAVADEIAGIGQNQHGLQNLVGTIQNDTQTLTSTVASVTDEQVRLHQTVEENSRQIAEMVSAIERNQQQWQNTINSIEENVQRLTISIDALGQNLLILQEVLQCSVDELAGVRGVDGSVDFDFSSTFTSSSEMNHDVQSGQ